MVIKVYVSGISGNKEVKKRQQRVVMILESKNIEYEAIDIAEPGKEADKEFMQQNSKSKDSKHALPPQIFNEDEYCGDYEEFDLANELDELEKFLKVPAGTIQTNDISKSLFTNGSSVTSSREQSTEKESVERHTVSSLSEDRISAEHDEETEQDDETTECKSPVNESENKDITDGEEEEEEVEEEETTTDKEKSKVEDGTNNGSVDHTPANNSDDDEEEEEKDEEE